MMEKDQPDSMATVQMTKADYAASEVYSTTSEPPPVSFVSNVLLIWFLHFGIIAYTLHIWSFV